MFVEPKMFCRFELVDYIKQTCRDVVGLSLAARIRLIYMDETEQELNSLRQANGNLVKSRKELQATLADAQADAERVGQLEGDLQDLQSSNQVLLDQKDALMGQLEEARSAVHELENLREALQQVSEERDQLTTENDSLKGANANLVGVKKSLQQQLDEYVSEETRNN